VKTIISTSSFFSFSAKWVNIFKKRKSRKIPNKENCNTACGYERMISNLTVRDDK
jgi:hypothetical protein